MAKGAGKARKKLPPELAVVYADNCTGCEACIEVCPVDCIYKVPGEDQPVLQSFVDIDLERCIGCKLCERWCPWDAIDMVPTTQIADAVAEKGGPPQPAKSSPTADDDKTPVPIDQVWRESKKESWDIPVVFVPATAPEWAELPQFWNVLPRQAASAPVAFLATPPLLVPALRLLE